MLENTTRGAAWALDNASSAYIRGHCALEIARSGTTVRSKSLLELAPWPLCARSHCSSSLRSHCALKITAPACSADTWRSKLLLRPLLLSHCALKITARPCSGDTLRSKLLLQTVRRPSSARLVSAMLVEGAPEDAPEGAVQKMRHGSTFLEITCLCSLHRECIFTGPH